MLRGCQNGGQLGTYKLFFWVQVGLYLGEGLGGSYYDFEGFYKENPYYKDPKIVIRASKTPPQLGPPKNQF